MENYSIDNFLEIVFDISPTALVWGAMAFVAALSAALSLALSRLSSYFEKLGGVLRKVSALFRTIAKGVATLAIVGALAEMFIFLSGFQINNFFERQFGQTPDFITALVVCVCTALFLFSFVFRTVRDIAPALMVSAGIIGTFWGTFIALGDFQTGAESGGNLDHDAMVNSIPTVLGGMKSAFVTSLIGLFFGFVSKIGFRFIPEKTPDALPHEQNVLDLLGDIKSGISGESDKSLSSQIERLQAEYREGAAEIKQSIAGDGDSSVASQLIKLRNANSEGFKNLDSRMAGLAEAIGETLVDSLNSLIGELRETILNQLAEQLKKTDELLREKLSEMLDRIEKALIDQFGETFKQFNEATQAIKKWQEEHRAHVEQLTAAFQTTAEGITRIRVECESIPATMEQLRTLMGELDERLRAFADMKKSAEESFPVIKGHLDSIGADLKKSAEGFSGLEETITRSYEQAASLAQQHIATAQSHIENVGAEINRTAAQLTETAGSMITESRAAAAQHQEAMQAAANEMQNALATLTENIRKQFSDSAEEIKTAAENMISESRNASVQQREEIRTLVDNAQAASQRCIEETQTALTQMAEQHAQTTSDAMANIAEQWGQNMTGIANQLRQTIQEHRQ